MIFAIPSNKTFKIKSLLSKTTTYQPEKVRNSVHDFCRKNHVFDSARSEEQERGRRRRHDLKQVDQQSKIKSLNN
jgi:hypothetical protein